MTMDTKRLMWHIVSKEQAIALWDTNTVEIYKLYSDGSEGLCESLEDIIDSKEELGIELEPRNLKVVETPLIIEWCNHCDTEVELQPLYKTPQICPNCGKWIMPCCLCNHDIEVCGTCEGHLLCSMKNEV